MNPLSRLLMATRHVFLPVITLFVLTAGVTALATAVEAAVSQAAASAPARATTRFTITVPNEETELVIDGNQVQGTGTSRTFETQPLTRGTTQKYTFVATWKPNSYTTMTRTKTVTFRAGEPTNVNLAADDPNDRVKVIYVPTPADVAEEMARLAGITPNDVVFEPGCGDARITIAAVKAGAKRGVGIDLDAERVAESRANVKAAGLENKIEIRLGDALDVKDISAATVVLLYMGDHFDMLIRPILWKQLKVGSRIVSHRFRMGDWEPDKTVTVTSAEGGEYELHLWTITEEVKKRAGGGR